MKRPEHDTPSAAASPETARLLESEDRGWNELHALMDSLTPEQMERPGYFEEGWSAKDVLAHVGSWLAEAGQVLVRIRMGTHRPEKVDIDGMNARFLELMKDVPLETVRAQAVAARARMLRSWSELPELTDQAAFWIRKAGAEHYDEHLPRLRDWIAQLSAGEP